MASCFSCFKPWKDDDLQKERLKAFKELEDIQAGAGNTHGGAEADIAAKLITTKVSKPDATGADGQSNPETLPADGAAEAPTQQTAGPSEAADGNAESSATDGQEQSGTADPANRHSPDEADPDPASPGPGGNSAEKADAGAETGDDGAAVCVACGSPCASPRSAGPDCSPGGGSTATAGATTATASSGGAGPYCSSCGGGAGPSCSEGGGGGLPAVPEAAGDVKPRSRGGELAAGSEGGKPRHLRCIACASRGNSPVASPRGGAATGCTPDCEAGRRPPLSAASSSRSLAPPPSVGERTPATPKQPRTPGSSRYGWGGGAYIAGGPSGGVRKSTAFPSPQRSGGGGAAAAAKGAGVGRTPSASAAAVGGGGGAAAYGAARRNPTASPGVGSYGAGAASVQRGGSGRLFTAASAGLIGSRNTPTPPPPGVYTSASTRLALHDVLHHRGSRAIGASGRSGFSVNSLANIDFRPAWR